MQVLKENKIDEWEELEKEVHALKDKYKDITYYRRKHLAHFDILYSTGEKGFDTSTHIDEVHSFLESMRLLINKTYKSLGQKDRIDIFMNPARHRGSNELLRILKKEMKNKYSS